MICALRWSRQTVRRLGGSGLDAELVAFRVGHDGMVRVAARHGGAEPLQSGHLVFQRTGGAQVEVRPVLGRLGLGNPGEPDIRAAPARRFDEGLLGGGVLVHIRPEHRRPELGQRERGAVTLSYGDSWNRGGPSDVETMVAQAKGSARRWKWAGPRPRCGAPAGRPQW